ncbi:MAG: PilZ domain-containing protein [Gammaproteobacteria bacterium]|nr:PilZ domain-containing protein [Gammaproteobacteria bacterium]
MEHRYNVRIPVTGDINVYFQPAGWLSAGIIDMSTGGASLALHQGAVPLYAPISVALRFDRSNASEWFQLRAMVVRAQKNVIGIMYLEQDNYTARALGRLLEEGSRIPPLARRRETVMVAPMAASVR